MISLTNCGREERNVKEEIKDARKLGNDALYEIRNRRVNLQNQITSIQTRINKDLAIIAQGIQGQIVTTIANIQKSLTTSQAEQKRLSGQLDTQSSTITSLQSANKSLEGKVNNIKIPTPTAVDVSNIIASAKQAAVQEVNGLRNQVNSLVAQLTGIQTIIPVLSSGISNVAKSASTANTKADAAMNEARNKGVPDLSPLQKQFDKFTEENKKALGIKDLEISNLSKNFNQQFKDFQRQNDLSSDQRFAEFTKRNNEALGIRDLKISDLSKDFDRRLADFNNSVNLDSQQRFDKFVEQNKQDLRKIGGDLSQSKTDIKKIEEKIKEGEKLNEKGYEELKKIGAKIDGVIPTIAGIPLVVGKAADGINSNISKLPNIGDIENAATTGVCRSTKPGGCMNKALNDQSNNINNNTNNAANNILQGLDTAGTGALVAGQQEILNRLGAQIPGGIGGKLERFSKWLHLDRALNLMIFAATVHNALMLSNDIGQTLLGAINNVLQLIGLKDSEDNAFDLGSIISSSIENLIKGIIGADNYTELKEAWAKANRIYQATTNVLNNFLNLTQVVLQAAELIAAYTGKIGNALKKGGVILENAYGWMNPQPKFNRVTQTLESLQNGASTIQMVTQAPLDIVNATTELTTASTDFIKAIKEDDKPNNKATPTPEPDELKAKETSSKDNSQPLSFDFSDLFDGED